MNAVEISNLTVLFQTRNGPVKAVDGLTLNVPVGHVVGFLGPNGAGKTTTIHVLLGFMRPTSGAAKVLGSDVREAAARRRIGYLAEHPDTYRFLTGRELLTATGRLFDLKGPDLSRRVDSLLERVGLSAAADRRISTYSRGMMQRVCLAQTLVNDPEIVILDEPTSGLDPIGRMDIRSLMSDLRRQGKTVFFSSHELSEVEMVCDRLAIMAKGRLVAEGPVEELVPRGERLEQYFMRMVMPK
jgi:ABC-2 type transport system ATP-binding protein